MTILVFVVLVVGGLGSIGGILVYGLSSYFQNSKSLNASFDQSAREARLRGD